MAITVLIFASGVMSLDAPVYLQMYCDNNRFRR